MRTPTLLNSGNSTLSISGGTIERSLYLSENTSISGGTLESQLILYSGSETDITGGIFLDDFLVYSGANITLSGGSFADYFNVRSGGTLNLEAQYFFLDGRPLSGFDFIGDSIAFAERSGILEVLFEDGSWHSFDLRAGADNFDDDAIINLVLSNPTNTLSGDFNLDGVVDAGDYTIWRDQFGQKGDSLMADGNQDGTVDSHDYDMWKNHFGSRILNTSATTTAIPEPTALLLLLMAVACPIIQCPLRERR